MKQNFHAIARSGAARTMVVWALPFALAVAGQAAELVTTTPVTQDRDHRTYNWQQRHADVLARNQQFKPEVAIIGDSIIHYWGGEPKGPVARGGEQAWSNCFAGVSVVNLGFGSDRTENVLWRLQHGELDGIEPKVIIIKIGTNNIGINPPEDIAAGIQAICAAAQSRQPNAKILLLGILPRRADKPGEGDAERVNRLLAARYSDAGPVTFRDVGKFLLKEDGTPNAALYADIVHVNKAGYGILGERIREEMTALMKK